MKRAMDITGSLIALVLLSPLLLVIALTIKLTSKGRPVFCRRKGVGQYGLPFVFLAFRSMYLTNKPSKYQAIPPGVYAQGTLVGSFLFETGLDELLPQFFNVLKGEMSLVGPRPLSSENSEKLSAQLEIQKCPTGLRGCFDLFVNIPTSRAVIELP
jgi:lipopolysaccharide/colanic/teichoic acid biosynthesis glycosyltransferase